eukprot:1161873-Pelagomonas_calceolata.AAC.11
MEHHGHGLAEANDNKIAWPRTLAWPMGRDALSTPAFSHHPPPPSLSSLCSQKSQFSRGQLLAADLALPHTHSHTYTRAQHALVHILTCKHSYAHSRLKRTPSISGVPGQDLVFRASAGYTLDFII